VNNTNTPTTAPLLVDRREAGRLLGVSPGTIDNLRTRGELPSVKIAARRLFDVADLRRYIEAQKVATAAPAASANTGGPEGGAA
jgi:excisionase family DNA binding protein